jgi:hypothetical protein
MPIHHTLKAWQHARRLAVECVKAAGRFPDYEQAALATETSKTLFGLLRKSSPVAQGSAPG